MRLRGPRRIASTLPLAALALALAPGLTGAAPLVDPLDVQGLELADGRMMPTPPAAVWGASSGVDPRVAHPGLVRLRQEVGPVWVAWSPARGSAAGLIVADVEAPGTVASPARAQAFARAFLARHLDVLAPGSTIDDFEVVGNDLSAGVRSVGLRQRHRGVPVEGGQLSVRFRADRLVMVASQALPRVEVPTRSATVAPAKARDAARAWMAADLDPGAVLTVGGPAEGTLVLPLWTGSGWAYREVVVVRVQSRSPLGEWAVYLDAETGAAVAREQLMRSVATVRFDVPVRHPLAARYDALAPDLSVTQGGMPALTDGNGVVALTQSPTTLGTTASGPLVAVSNDVGSPASASFPVSNGGTVVWSAPGDEHLDAQLSAFVHASLVKAYVRELAPGLGWLDQTVQVNVNLGGSCNAASDGDSLYFLLADGSCQNTARLADVVYHEFGHSVHNQSIIPGVGAFESSLSEGISDYLAATIVDDSGMGRGFTYTNEPLRELDPDGYEWSWPQDMGEAHYQGQIIGGTLWDLRQALRGTLGDVAGRVQADTLWYESIRRAVDIPSMYVEALVADDDDGSLANGTPNACEINDAFGAHGLLDPSQLGDVVIDATPVTEGRRVSVALGLPVLDGCPLDAGTAQLRWRERGDAGPGTAVDMVVEDGAWVATIPNHDAGVVVEYQVQVDYSTGTSSIFPNNAADPWYQLYFGAVVPIYCLDAEANQGEWFFSGSGDTWSFGPLVGGGIDPAEPYDDDGVQLSQDGTYPAFANTAATSPFIDISGRTDVRLHYRRWLTVEDGFFDHATIRANGQPVWTNLTTPQTNVHHVDREWRFHDVPLADFIDDGQVQLQFALDSDGGLQLGGWTIDALCVVEVVESVCGDGLTSGTEECDDGNAEDGDGCDASCVLEPDPTGDPTGDPDGDSGGTSSAGTGVVDDTGNDTPGSASNTDDDGGSSGSGEQDGSGGDGCGCASQGPSRSGPAGAALVLLALGLRRRRTPATRG